MNANHSWAEVEPVATDIDALVKEAMAGSSKVAKDSMTLPPQAYSAQAFYDLEVEKIFKKEWLCVGHVSQVAKVGDYFCVDIIGEPLVVVRGKDEKIRVLSRVCLHRWAPVATGSGNTRIFSCPFHRWGYALDGQLLGTPFMEQVDGFRPRDCRLPEVRSEIVDGLGLIFITFNDQAPSIGEKLRSLAERVERYQWRGQVVVDTNDTVNQYNWKILIETYMECYHHIGAHSESLQPYKPGGLSWCEDEHDGWSVCHSILRKDLPPEKAKGFYDNELLLAYPMLLMGANPARCGFQVLLPQGPNQTRLIKYSLARPEEIGTPEFAERLERGRERGALIQSEDNAVNDMQQLGAGSMLARTGRLSHLENSVWHLAEYIRARITA